MPGRGDHMGMGRIVPTTDASQGRPHEDYRETADRGEARKKPLKPEAKGIIGKIKGIWFKWKE